MVVVPVVEKMAEKLAGQYSQKWGYSLFLFMDFAFRASAGMSFVRRRYLASIDDQHIGNARRSAQAVQHGVGRNDLPFRAQPNDPACQ